MAYGQPAAGTREGGQRMSTHGQSSKVRLAAVGLLVTALVAAAAVAALAGLGARAAASPQARAESIKVHGAWTIQVRRPDGTVLGTRRFHNSLVVPFGSQTIVDILGRQNVPGLWVVLLNSQGTSPWDSGQGLV